MRAVGWTLGLSLLIITGAAAQQAGDLPGMSGNEIKALQQRLADGGCYSGEIDGLPSEALLDGIKACPSQNPILRIDTGMHVAQFNQIGVDRACELAATGSLDKTVRVWSLPGGRLLRTLRVPIGPGYGGMIFATAMSPDGRWIAAAGWDAHSKIRKENFVYIFDAATGAMVARAGPFGNVIMRLAFSPDGRWLAATSAADVGIKVIDAQTWQIIAQDGAYAGISYGAAFARDGRLYAVAYDGKLRQYGPGPAFRKEREVATQGTKQPTSVAVDPRGQLVAVAFNDVSKVDVYYAATLRLRSTVKYLGRVAWVGDGARLIAGGYPLRTFSRDGQLIGKPVPVGRNTIMDLQPCADAVAVATADPAFGLIDGSGQTELWKTGVAPDMRSDLGDFTIAPDAKRVRFGLGGGNHDPVLFDLAQATVASAPKPLPGFLAPSTEGLPVGNWRNGNRYPGTDLRPTFAGKPIQLSQNDEGARSLAIRTDRTGFVLGTDYSLRAFDAQGRQLWQQPGPSVAWGVNLSADGRIIVAAYHDGTIRWHRWSDGRELLALFINRQTKAWISWTPTGYYTASPSGEDLIGWHLNRGWNQAADFFPASRFRDRFNRPDIVDLVLTTLDEGEAIKQANDAAKRKPDTRPLIGHLPPIIRIINPTDDARVEDGVVTLDYALRSPSGRPVERVDLLINGRPIKAFGLPIKPLPPDVENKGSIQIALTQHVSEVGLVAWSEGLASQAAQVKVTWVGAPEATCKLYALVIGVSDYADPAMALKYAAKDAGDFARALRAQKGRYYVDVETRVLADRMVTRASVVQGLQWLEQMATNPNDVSVLFVAGHGMTDEKQTYWFYTSDATDDDVRIKGVSQDELRKSLQGLQGKVLWFLDTCHAGAAAKRPPVDVNVLVNTMSASENGGIVVFASSTGRQVSIEGGDLGNGAFTRAVVEGIELGKAALGDGFITTSTLDSYVVRRVEQFTDNKQTPVMGRPPDEPDFTIAAAAK